MKKYILVWQGEEYKERAVLVESTSRSKVLKVFKRELKENVVLNDDNVSDAIKRLINDTVCVVDSNTYSLDILEVPVSAMARLDETSDLAELRAEITRLTEIVKNKKIAIAKKFRNK
jgi:hypothetical protein